MALSEVYGLERFSEYMKGLEDCYARLFKNGM